MGSKTQVFGVMELFCVLIVVVVTRIDAWVKIHRSVHTHTVWGCPLMN